MSSHQRQVKKLPKALYEKIYSKVPRLTVDIIIRFDSGLVLVKRDIPPCKGMWHLPGGTVLLGESLKDAVLRIAREETGLIVRVDSRLMIKEYSRRTAFGGVISIVYLATSAGGVIKGNRYGRNVQAFRRLPARMIAAHRDILDGLARPKVTGIPQAC